MPDRDDGDGGFHSFFASEYGLVVSFLCKAGFDYHIADDATAEAMTTAYRDWPKITSPRAWIRTAAYRVATKKTTASRNEVTRLISKGYGCTSSDGTEWYRHLEWQDELLQVLAGLPKQRRIVMAWYLDGFNIKEIASAMDILESTVRSHLRFARRTLRKQLTNSDSGEARR